MTITAFQPPFCSDHSFDGSHKRDEPEDIAPGAKGDRFEDRYSGSWSHMILVLSNRFWFGMDRGRRILLHRAFIVSALKASGERFRPPLGLLPTRVHPRPSRGEVIVFSPLKMKNI